MLSATLGALADPTRRSIVDRLARGEATVGELARPFRISQQAISKHVARLERARLVEKRRIGRHHLCRLRPAAVKQVADWAGHYRRFWEASLDRLGAYLEEMKQEQDAKETGHARKPTR